MNTRRIGSIVSGPIIAIGSLTVLGQRGIFLTSAFLTLIGLAIITIANRTTTKPSRNDQLAAST
jgi:SET family sugar efflux transporter-like MFS transporter